MPSSPASPSVAAPTGGTPITRVRRLPVLVFLVSWVGIAVLSCLWAVMTPVGASPDEPSHFIKAASVVRGQLLGDVTDKEQVRDVDVPVGIAYPAEATCYAFQPDVTAGCMPSYPADPEAVVEEPTTAGLYNPVYYVLVGWPSLLLDGKAALFGMRLVSAVLTSGLFALAVAAASRLPRPVLPVAALLAALTPTTYFLNGSVNPNSFEAATSVAFLAVLLAAVATPTPTRVGWGSAAVLVLTGGLLVHARGLSPAWLVLDVLVAFAVAGPRRSWAFLRQPPALVSVAIVTVSSLLAGVWILRTGSLGAVGQYAGTGTTFVGGIVKMLERTFTYATDMVGNFGWLDTPAPTYVTFSYFLAVGVLVMAALVVPTSLRLRVALWLAVVLYLLFPAVVQASSVTESGYVWQGRYNLPVYLLAVLVAAHVLAPTFDGLRPVVRRRVVGLVVTLVVLSSVTTVLTSLKRNTVGLSASWVTMLRDPQWHPPYFGTPTWSLAALAAALLLGACLLLVVRAASRAGRGAGGGPVAPQGDGVPPAAAATAGRTTAAAATTDRE